MRKLFNLNRFHGAGLSGIDRRGLRVNGFLLVVSWLTGLQVNWFKGCQCQNDVGCQIDCKYY